MLRNAAWFVGGVAVFGGIELAIGCTPAEPNSANAQATREALLRGTATAAAGQEETAKAIGPFNEQAVETVTRNVGLISVSFVDKDGNGGNTRGTGWVVRLPTEYGQQDGRLYIATAGHVLTHNGKFRTSDITGIDFWQPGKFQMSSYQNGARAAVPEQYDGKAFTHDIGLACLLASNTISIGDFVRPGLPYDAGYLPHPNEKLLFTGYPDELASKSDTDMGTIDVDIATFQDKAVDQTWDVQLLADYGGSGSPLTAISGRVAAMFTGGSDADPRATVATTLMDLPQLFTAVQVV